MVEGVDGLPGFGAGAVVGVDVDPPDGAAGVEDDGGGHRQGGGAVGVDAGQVESEVQLGGAGLGRRASEDAEAAGDGVAGVGDDGEGQAVLLLRGQRPVWFCGLIATSGMPRSVSCGSSCVW